MKTRNIPPLKVVFSKNDRKEILAKVDHALKIGYVAMGENVKEFEERFSAYNNSKHSISVSSCSSALEIMMRALNVQNKEVLVPDNTFLATAAGVMLAGGKARMVDIDKNTFSISLKELKKQLTSKTVGVIIVHIGGIITPELPKIKQWCDDNGLWLIEDAAHAHGSELNGRKAGTFGLAGAFSFFSTKVITSGEGGMIVTNDDKFAKEIKLMRNHGKPEPWVSYHTEMGSNWRMSELNSIVGVTQLKRLDEFIEWRENVANIYTEQLRDIDEIGLVLPKDRSSWYKYIIILNNELSRDVVKQKMKDMGVVLAGEVYEIPLHKQPVFNNYDKKTTFPNSADVCSRHICLPIYYGMTASESKYVIKSLKKSIMNKG